MLKIKVFDIESNVSVVDYDIFSAKAISVFLITTCIYHHAATVIWYMTFKLF